jgi:hypothetical protein
MSEQVGHRCDKESESKSARRPDHGAYRDETDPAQVKLLLDVKPRASDGYWWVTCHHCHVSWHVLHYAESTG